jgi:iron complex outermembrane recepter protein
MTAGQDLMDAPESKVSVSAGDAVARWSRAFSSDSDISLQVYYDRYNRFEEGFHEIRDTVDFDFHQHLKIGSRHDVVWGLGYRVMSDNVGVGFVTAYLPPKRTDNLFSGFFQDEIRLARPLSLTLGAKVEHNSYTGVEFEPSAQLVWRLTNRQQIWASSARAIRQPSRADVGVQAQVATIPPSTGGFGVVQYSGDPDEKAEESRDFEIGYRSQIARTPPTKPKTIRPKSFPENLAYLKVTLFRPRIGYAGTDALCRTRLTSPVGLPGVGLTAG